MNWLPLTRASAHLIFAERIARKLREPNDGGQSYEEYRQQMTDLILRIQEASDCIDRAEQLIEETQKREKQSREQIQECTVRDWDLRYNIETGRAERSRDRDGYRTVCEGPQGASCQDGSPEHTWVAGPIGPSGRPDFFCRSQEAGR